MRLLTLLHKYLLLSCLALLLLTFNTKLFAADPIASADFSSYYQQIYQIRVVSQNAKSKSSIGSGFQVSPDGLIVTNYHVVSEYIQNPNHYEIRYAAESGETGALILLDFDIVNDLAILKHPNPNQTFFTLAEHLPKQGEIAHALGNPGDWGIVMVSGPTNGQVDHTFKDTILFSGSLNSGMSGGPSMNDEGEVIGVNVATAGSQLSFLIPAQKVRRLMLRDRVVQASKYNLEVSKQIRSWQNVRVKTLIETEWSGDSLFGRKLIGELRRDFQCWGDSNDTDEEREIEWAAKWCEAGDDIFISSQINAGHISYTFRKRRPIKLNSMQFARRQSVSLYPDNSSDYEHSTNYLCQTDFLNSESSDEASYTRIVTCLRAFKKYPGLYDSLMLIQHQKPDEVFEAEFSLSAMNKQQIKALNRRFAENSL